MKSGLLMASDIVSRKLCFQSQFKVDLLFGLDSKKSEAFA